MQERLFRQPRSQTKFVDTYLMIMTWRSLSLDDSANCCTGSHNTPAKCPSSGERIYSQIKFDVIWPCSTGVAYYKYFKDNCPNSYAYAYDEASHTALWTCDSKKKADYTLTFCPSGGKLVEQPAGGPENFDFNWFLSLWFLLSSMSSALVLSWKNLSTMFVKSFPYKCWKTWCV